MGVIRSEDCLVTTKKYNEKIGAMYYFKNDGWVKNKNYTLPTEIKEDFEVLP
jgi:hypothetical protein